MATIESHDCGNFQPVDVMRQEKQLEEHLNALHDRLGIEAGDEAYAGIAAAAKRDYIVRTLELGRSIVSSRVVPLADELNEHYPRMMSGNGSAAYYLHEG